MLPRFLLFPASVVGFVTGIVFLPRLPFSNRCLLNGLAHLEDGQQQGDNDH